MKFLTQNSKMKKSNNETAIVYNWTLRAVKDCPKAGQCAAGCYATMGAYRWSNVAAKHQKNFEATKTESFVKDMINEIVRLARNAAKKNKTLYIRVHDAGDFYSRDYALKWMSIAEELPNVKFYAYTKSLHFFKGTDAVLIPDNFTLIFSQGGKLDADIDTNSERHSRVFESLEELENAGYINASDNDLLALTENKKVGLVYHGNKNFNKTAWSKVA